MGLVTGIGVSAGRGHGGHMPPQFLRVGRNPWVIRPKHKNFRKNYGMSGKIFGCLRKLWDIRGNFLICAEKFLHVCENHGY